MDWLAGMNGALGYIEENLAGEISLEEASRHVCCTPYYFQRIFAVMAGVPLSEYIRKRRLSRAAHDLQTTPDKVIDVALRYGYESPTAFARAFAALHGLSPNKARERGATLTAYPPISFQITIKGAVAMEYRIETVAPFRAVGAVAHTRDVDGENNREIPDFWTACREKGILRQLEAMGGKPAGAPAGLLGICGPLLDENARTFDYTIAVATSEPCPPGLVELTVEGGSYAVFETAGVLPDSIQELSARIWTEWLPNSGYKLGRSMDFEVYPPDDGFDGETRTQVWIPVVK